MTDAFLAARRLAARAVAQPDTLGDGDCEELRTGLVGQPVNTLTSLGYVAVGVWLLERTRRVAPGRRATARWYGAMVSLTGAGSVAYHGPQFEGAQLLHDIPVAGVIGMGVAVPLVRRFRDEVGLSAPATTRVLVAAGLGAAAGLAYLSGRTGSSSCDPSSLWQWHGLWHLGTAAAAAVWATALWPTTALVGVVEPDAAVQASP